MLNATNSETTVTGGGLMETVLFAMVTTVPCLVILLINGTMLYTLRSKPVFCETSRYILLYNLLVTDTILLVQSQLLYLLAASRMRLTYPLCGVFFMISRITNEISPLTVVVMSLERYVAVCYPLRHATITTIRNTGMAIIVLWAFGSLNALTRILLILEFPFSELESLQMKDFCGKDDMLLDPMSVLYDRAITYFVFVSSGVAVTCSYIAVVIAARSASSTDKASAQKAHKTLLLHLVQLGFCVSSTVHNPILFSISKSLDRIIIIRIQIFLYLCIIILPRCLSSLIYGLRDQAIKPVLVHNLCCQWRHSPFLSVIPAKKKVGIIVTK